MQSSRGMNKLIRIIELKIIINGTIYKNVLDLYLKSEKIPILWRKYFMEIANDIIRPKQSIQLCREIHYCHFNER